jgi:hypothetical protein
MHDCYIDNVFGQISDQLTGYGFTGPGKPPEWQIANIINSQFYDNRYSRPSSLNEK